MFEINNRTAAPYSSISYLRSEWADGTTTRASAVVVGVNDVLTALHTVYSAERGGWARSITVIPGADTQPASRPFGEYTDVGYIAGRASNWDLNGDGLLSQAESEGDMALIGMRSRIGDAVGVLPLAQVSYDFSGTMLGYPGRGTGLMAESVYADAASWYSLYNIDSGLGSGASGGPLLANVNGVNSVVGVLSSGNFSNTVSTYAGLYSADSWNWLQGAMVANDYLIAPSMPTSVATVSGTVFSGGSGADSLIGGLGRDFFTGYAGADVIDGGAGVDTAVYLGSRSNYTVTLAAGSVTVADSVTGRDGVDSLRNVERVKFADVSIAFDIAGSAGQAYRLYKAALSRAPDLAGLGHQMKALDEGLSLEQVSANFLASPEFQGRYAGADVFEFVTLLYANVLGRVGDAQGFAFHTSNLATGTVNRPQLLIGFSESPEHQAQLIGVIQNGISYLG